MLINTIFGFILPWAVIGTYLYKKDNRIIFLIVPFSSAIAYSVDAIGFYYKFWSLTPVKYNDLSALPTDLGYFALIGGLLIYAVKKYVLNDYLVLLIFSIATTVFEYIFVLAGEIIYGNGWNVFWTFFSYIIPYSLVYFFYLTLKTYGYME